MQHETATGTSLLFITFPVSRRREMNIGHTGLCLCVCLFITACPHYCTDPDESWGNGSGCPLVVHNWADLQSVHCTGFVAMTTYKYVSL